MFSTGKHPTRGKVGLWHWTRVAPCRPCPAVALHTLPVEAVVAQKLKELEDHSEGLAGAFALSLDGAALIRQGAAMNDCGVRGGDRWLQFRGFGMV